MANWANLYVHIAEKRYKSHCFNGVIYIMCVYSIGGDFYEKIISSVVATAISFMLLLSVGTKAIQKGESGVLI